MKVSLENLQDIGKGVQEQFNSLISIFDQNIVERKLKIGNLEILTNAPIQSLESFKDIVDRMCTIGCAVGILKREQILNKNKITIIEEQIGCYKCLLKNYKIIRFHLYAKREDLAKNIHITGGLRFDEGQAEQYITRHIQILYTRISNLRVELANMREGELIDLDEGLFEIDDLLVGGDEPVTQSISKNEKSTVDSNPSN